MQVKRLAWLGTRTEKFDETTAFFRDVLGIPVLLILAVMAHRGSFGPAYYTPVELFGLYWHFVDIVWIFLFPLLYLIGSH